MGARKESQRDVPDESLMTIDDVVTYLKLSKRKIREMIADKSIPHLKIDRSIRFQKGELEKWTKRQTVKEG